MDAKEAYKKWGKLAILHSDKAYVKSKFQDEIQDRLEICVLRVTQGLARARKYGVLPAQCIKRAQEALLDIAQANEELTSLAAGLSMEAMDLKDRMEWLERCFELEEPAEGENGARKGVSQTGGKDDEKHT